MFIQLLTVGQPEDAYEWISWTSATACVAP